MDPSDDLFLTPDSGGSGTDGDGNGGRSVSSSLRRRLMSELNAAADGGDSGSSSSSPPSRARDAEPDESHHPNSRHRGNPEASPAQNQVGLLLLLSPVGSPAATDDEVLIMDGVLVDNGRGTPSSARRSPSTVVNNNGNVTPSSARRSASAVDSNGFVTPSSARRSALFANNNGPGNRRSVSINDLMLLSSSARGSNGGGSGGRRGGSNGQFYQRREEHRGTQALRNRHSEGQGHAGSPSRRQVQGAGGSNIRPGPDFSYPISLVPGPNFPYPVHHGLEFSYPSNNQLGQLFPMAAPPPPPLPWMGLPSPYFTYTQPVATVDPLPYYAPPAMNMRMPQGYPPPGITILPPPGGRAEGPSASEQPEPRRVTIKAPPASEGGPSEPKQPETKPPPPAPEQPETQLPQDASPLPPYMWPPNAEAAAAVYEGLYRPSGRIRLPVFQDLCPDAEPSTPPPPPPLRP